MFRKILIPLDGSSLAERAMLHVVQLVPPGSAELVLVNVIETYRYSSATMEMAPVDVLSYVRSGIEAYMDEQRKLLEMKQYAVQTYIAEGDAAQEILNVADTAGAELIVMTTHGRAGVARWALGSVAERVIHNAKQPVWLVRESTQVVPPQELRRILVPLDGSILAEQALEQAQKLAQYTGAELLLLRVVPELDETNRRMLFASEEVARATFQTWQIEAERYLAEIAERVTRAGIVTRTQVSLGAPVRAILEAVAAENVDCIAMATHARLGFGRMLHGSVAVEVSRHCGCPLLLVRAQGAPVSEAAAPEATPEAEVTMPQIAAA